MEARMKRVEFLAEQGKKIEMRDKKIEELEKKSRSCKLPTLALPDL
jgi:hypothetical protein